MITAWTKHLKTEEEQERFRNTVKSAKPVLERLTELLNEELNGLERYELSTKQFDNPNWAEKQAFQNGYRAAMSIVNNIINLDQQKDK